MFSKLIVVDAKGHLLGRLASVVAKELLNGQKIVVVRAEEINISGSLFRNKIKFSSFLRKRTATNPTRGHWHYRAPARIFWRVVRGMIPHKTHRGEVALNRLKVFEGVPSPFDRIRRQVVPSALRILRLKHGRKYCRLGDVSSSFGWKHDSLIQTLEEKRKVRSNAKFLQAREEAKLRVEATKRLKEKLAPLNAELVKLGGLLPRDVQ